MGELEKLLVTANPEKGKTSPMVGSIPKPLRSSGRGASELPLHERDTTYSSLHENDGMSFIQQINHGSMDMGMWVLLPQWLWQHPQGEPCSRWDVRSRPVPSPLELGYPGNLQPSSTTTSSQKLLPRASEHSAGTDTNLHTTVPAHFAAPKQEPAFPQRPALLLNTTDHFKCTFHTKAPKTNF